MKRCPDCELLTEDDDFVEYKGRVICDICADLAVEKEMRSESSANG